MAGRMMAKPWRLSSSVVVLAPRSVVGGEPLSKRDTPRASPPADYKICFVKRTAKASFMPDQMVFPGGAVDPADRASSTHFRPGGTDVKSKPPVQHSRHSAPGPPEHVIRVAACREAFEEAGVPIVTPQPPQHEWFAACAKWRQAVHDDASKFPQFCGDIKVEPAVDELLYWCSFITPDPEHDRLKKGGFDARFYVWCAHEGSPVTGLTPDDAETVQLVWLEPQDALDAVASGAISMAPPQWFIVQELARFCPTLAEVPKYSRSASRALARDYPIKPHPVQATPSEAEAVLSRNPGARAPAGEKETPVFALAYPGDAEHPEFPGPSGSRHRMLMAGRLGAGMRAYELQQDDFTTHLPLPVPTDPWYALAKI